ncbi:MAG: rhomboid family intramembrane serine protease [Candidatus Omnitrophica bacterium]|nr:rhomboid family intramembrane serine protease [Candidatus Omnitrophota bacterium]
MGRYAAGSSYSGFNIGVTMTKTVKVLIIINVAMFLLVNLISGFPWLSIFGLVPRYVFGKLRVWQLATYLFLHAGLWHLAVNMLMLWFFGPAIEASWGSRRFLSYYFFTGIGAGLCSYLTAFRSGIPVIGASGAIFGILVAYAMMFPDTIVLMFFIFPMKIRHAVLFLAGINLLGALSAPQAGIAYFAHLGGGLFGYLYLKNEWIRRKLSYWRWNPSGIAFLLRQKKARRKEMTEKELDQKVDLILDKVSKYGLDSLSKQERRILELKSKKEKTLTS